MGNVTGFLDVERQSRQKKEVQERTASFDEFMLPLPQHVLNAQAGRCMDCGVPYCHEGCPVHNVIPEFNDLIYQDDWRDALDVLHQTNNFPEFTGRICPAPCEAACTLNLIDSPVTIKDIECAIIDYGWQQKWIAPQPPNVTIHKHVAIIGSGPAGMACGQQLTRQGFHVTIYEKQAFCGGLLRYGIPDFKLDKKHIERRIEQMRAEGTEFKTQCHVGDDIPWREMEKRYDAIVFAMGAEVPRDLPIAGRHAQGIHFAMDFLTQQNKRVARETIHSAPLHAQGKHVIVIGGGDTGSDCIGTANRQGALSVTQLEILEKPPRHENKALEWPYWPTKLRSSTSHEEGASRLWAVSSQGFLLDDSKDHVVAIELCDVTWEKDSDHRRHMNIVGASKRILKADMVLLAMGFLHPTHTGLLTEARVSLDERGNIKANTTDYRSSQPHLFACGDARRGQSLVVWAIREGRQCADAVARHLMA
ncbi:MAG: glutamate synthase subunit beta [Alphaproteobacteria bacterium GM7ARS4]|nr:glutamate synthase subunit beta [Alphaproteobacteria bacterium GM7ARS4]